MKGPARLAADSLTVTMQSNRSAAGQSVHDRVIDRIRMVGQRSALVERSLVALNRRPKTG